MEYDRIRTLANILQILDFNQVCNQMVTLIINCKDLLFSVYAPNF